MKRRALALSSVLCACMLAACGTTAPEPQVSSREQRGPGQALREKTVKISASVESIDPDTRMVSLRGSDGKRVSLRVDDSVNLAEIKKGDVVAATYYEAVAVRLRKPGEATPGASVAEGAARSEQGDKPAVAGVRSYTIIATVRAIDREKQTATLEGQDGKLQTLTVADPRNLDIAGIGDLVEITYSEGVAIAVEKPASK